MKIRWWASQGALSMGSIKHRNNKTNYWKTSKQKNTRVFKRRNKYF